MRWQYSDGGRAAANFKGRTNDCVCRAIAIAFKLPYQQVYDDLNKLATREKPSKTRCGKSSARTGMHKVSYHQYIISLGAKWIPTMMIGQGCKVHLRDGELPKGRLIVKVSKHIVAVINGVMHDNHDPSRRGNRCVYGYYIVPERMS